MDYKNIERFWRNEANGRNRFSTMLSSFDFANYRHKSEQKKIFPYLNLSLRKTVLDLGCGPGRWTIPLSYRCKKVVAVDYIDEPEFNWLKNVEYHQQNILDFETKEKFDIIFLSGVLPYINDVDINSLLNKCYSWLKEDGKLVIITTVSLTKPFGRMDGNFEGCYRTLGQYLNKIDMFDNYDYMDSHGIYLGKLNKYSIINYVLGFDLLQPFRYWFIRNFKEYPGNPMIFICWK